MNQTTNHSGAVCSYCGAEISIPHKGGKPRFYKCQSRIGGSQTRPAYCCERQKSQELAAEVERLKANLRRAIEIAEVLDYPHAPYTDKYYNLWDQLDQIKATLSPGNK